MGWKWCVLGRNQLEKGCELRHLRVISGFYITDIVIFGGSGRLWERSVCPRFSILDAKAGMEDRKE
jgi:hypothetical protein